MSSNAPNTPDDAALQHALDEQQNLVETSLPAVADAYREALEANMPQPVVVLLDCQDEIGGAIARAWLGAEVVDDALAAGLDEGDETVVFATAYSWKDSAREVPAAFPYLSPVFKGGAPDDGVLVISVTSGGASALTAPFDALDQPE